MFKITNQITFKHQVKVMVPIDGGHERQDIKVTFRSLDPVEIDKFDIDTTEGVSRFLRATVTDVGDVVDDQGQAVPFSDKLMDQLLAFQFVRLPMVQAYFTAVQKAPEGN